MSTVGKVFQVLATFLEWTDFIYTFAGNIVVRIENDRDAKRLAKQVVDDVLRLQRTLKNLQEHYQERYPDEDSSHYTPDI